MHLLTAKFPLIPGGTFAVQAAEIRGDLVERVTGIEPALSAWEPVLFHRINVNVCNMFPW
jgi:hypothetical protein